MLKHAVCWVWVVFSINGLANDISSSGARTRTAVTTGKLVLAATQSQQGVNSAERDEALADIKKKIAGHEDELAEKVFKNIEILKGKKASRLPGMMAALTGLLGVNCTHCHVKDKWESEEKPTKQTARKMFRMIGGINDDYFEGQNKVSCWTCHRGNPHPPIQ